jgi:hypothetical protein
MELVLVGSRPISEATVLNFGTGPDDLTIDASGLTFLGPLDLAGIVAIARWAASGHMPVNLKLPRDPAVASYLQRMNVLLHLPQRVQIIGRVPPDGRTELRDRLLEVTPVDSSNAVSLGERLGQMVEDAYSRHSAGGAAAVFGACGELLSNAVEHGGPPAFVAAQVYTGTTTDGPRLEFAICDGGGGVMETLRKNPKHAHLTRDEVAIDLALEMGVSGTTDDGRGNGLRDVIEETRKYGRIEFQMRSGMGQVKVSAGPTSSDRTLSDRPEQTSGTWACLTHWMRASE